MRLWHQKLIKKLPRHQLLGQHRECCALRGLGWGKKHSTVDYVFSHSRAKLVAYHTLVMDEMIERGYSPALEWYNISYCGKKAEAAGIDSNEVFSHLISPGVIYPEHDAEYLEECLENLSNKSIYLEV